MLSLRGWEEGLVGIGDWWWGIGGCGCGCGCDEEEGKGSLLECGEVLIEWCGLMGRWMRDYAWEVFSCDDDEEEERKEEERLIRTMA